MKRFIVQIGLFFLLVILGSISFIILIEKLHYPKAVKLGDYNNNLFYIGENQKCDVVFLGSSRSVPFDKWSNSDTIKKELNIKVLNLSNQGGGLLNQKIYLSYFFKKNNKIDKIYYFIDPFVLNSSSFDYKTMFNKEPFKFDFFYTIAKNGGSLELLSNYFFSKIKFEKIIKPLGVEKKAVAEISAETIQHRFNYLYPENNSYNKQQEQKLAEIISIAKEYNVEMEFILLPTLLGKEPLYLELIKYLQELNANKNIKFHDFTSEMQDEKFYRDIDHLNSVGIAYFYRNYLKLIL